MEERIPVITASIECLCIRLRDLVYVTMHRIMAVTSSHSSHSSHPSATLSTGSSVQAIEARGLFL